MIDVGGILVHPRDAALLGLEPGPDAGTLSFLVAPRLRRPDGRFYGGAALAASLAAVEAVTKRRAIWCDTQIVGPAESDERITVSTDVLASGRHATQLQVRGTVGSRLVFNSIGAAVNPIEDSMSGTGLAGPRVPPPADCEDFWQGQWAGPHDQAWDDGPLSVSEYRAAPLLDTADHRPGRFAMWARLTGEIGATGTPTAASLGFLADMVAMAVCRMLGVEGAGTSLDNSLRIGALVNTEWVLLDLDADMATGGFGHGRINITAPDGALMATGSQTARLLTLNEFGTSRPA